MIVGDLVRHSPGAFAGMSAENIERMKSRGAIMDHTTIAVVLEEDPDSVELSDGYSMDVDELDLINVLDLCVGDIKPYWANINRIRIATALSDEKLLSLGCPKELL